MPLGIPGIKDHQAHENDHIRQPVKRRVEKTSEPGYAAGKTGHLAVQHVEEISDDEGDAGVEKPAQTKEKTATDVYSNADDGQNIRIDMTVGQPTYDGVNYSLGPTPDACPKHLLGSILLAALCQNIGHISFDISHLLFCFQMTNEKCQMIYDQSIPSIVR